MWNTGVGGEETLIKVYCVKRSILNLKKKNSAKTCFYIGCNYQDITHKNVGSLYNLVKPEIYISIYMISNIDCNHVYEVVAKDLNPMNFRKPSVVILRRKVTKWSFNEFAF